MKVIIFIFVFALSVYADGVKYNVGDCITPTESSYSWYGKYAKVTGKYEVWGKLSYALNFYNYDTTSNLFDVDIDRYTVKVNIIHCID